jgi:phospholipid/cholesterol/gamma-HCH transport system substrate-binding protein
VRRIRFEDPKRSNRVEVDIEISTEALNKIGSDSQVTVKTRGLLGEKYVDITPSAEIWDQVPERIEGRSVVKLEEVMFKSSQAFEKLNTILDRINRGEGTIGQLATREEPYQKLDRILTRLDRTLAGIESSKGTLNRLIYDDRLYEKMVALANTSGMAADELRELNRRLLSRDSSIGMLMGDREFYDHGLETMRRVDNSVRSLEEITGRLERGEGTAGRLLKDQELYDRLSRTAEDLDLLLKDVRENPKRYVNFSLF